MTVQVISADIEGNFGLGVYKRTDKKTVDLSSKFLIDNNYFFVLYRKGADDKTETKFPHGIIGLDLPEEEKDQKNVRA